MKAFISSLKLRLSDLFLFVGFIGFALFLVFGQEFMQHPNPNEVSFPLWVSIPSFIIMVGSWSYYLYLEVYKSKEKINLIIPSIFLGLIFLNIIAIAVQPEHSEVTTIFRLTDKETPVGTLMPVDLYVTGFHKFIFISEMIGVAMFIYIGLFVFPKRFTSYKFVLYLGYALYGLIAVLMIYSFITEFDRYILFINYFLGNVDKSTIDFNRDCTVKSFIIHRNAFGMVYMLGIIFAFINNSIKKQSLLNYILAGVFYIFMFFTFCKTAILLCTAIIAGYFLYRMILTFKEHKKRNIISLSVVAGVGVILVGVLAIAILTKGKVLASLYDLWNSVTLGGSTLRSREFIWDNTFLLLKDGWWLIGRGFGTINLLLRPLNLASHNDVAFPTHSSMLNMLAEGGIIFLLAYFVFLGYSGYIIYKCFKKDFPTTFAVSLGYVAFVLYSLIETIHYLALVFLFPIFIIYYLPKEESQKIEEKK